MPVITQEMDEAINRTAMCYVATVNGDGTPNLSPKASLFVIDDDHIGFCNLASPQTVANIKRNPAVEVNVVDIFIRKGFRFRGTAVVLQSGPDFDLLEQRFAARAGPGYAVLDVVKIAVEEALPLISPFYSINPDVDEADVRKRYLAVYGAQDG